MHEAKILRAIASGLIPPGGALKSGADEIDIAGGVDNYVSKFNLTNRAAIRTMLWLFEILPFFFTFRPLTLLSQSALEKVVESFEKSRFFLVRGPLLLLKLLCTMMFYNDEKIKKAIGYDNECFKEKV